MGVSCTFCIGGWAPTVSGLSIYPLCIILHFSTTHSTRQPQKIDGGVEMTMTLMTIEEFWTEAVAAGFDIVLPLLS